MKKFKSYLFLVPIIFVLCLNCFAILPSSLAVDYSIYHKLVTDLPDLGFDVSDPESICDLVGATQPYYIYTISMTQSDYNKYSNGESGWQVTLNFSQFSAKGLDTLEFTSDVYVIETWRGTSSSYTTITFTYSDGSLNITDNRTINLVGSYSCYNKSTGYFVYVTQRNSINYNRYMPNIYYFYQFTNIEEIELFTEYGDSEKFDVEIEFNPPLEGSVTRLIEKNGISSLNQNLVMIPHNRSSFPVQIRMEIFKESDYGNFSSEPVFVYYRQNWVYANKLKENISNDEYYFEKQLKVSDWHFVPENYDLPWAISYSIIPLQENVDYRVVVYATRCYGDIATELVTGSPGDSDFPPWETSPGEIVYSSTFRFLEFSDVKFSSSPDDFGNYPYSSKSDKFRYDFSYEARENDDGTIDYVSNDLFNDPTSWVHDRYDFDLTPSVPDSFAGLVGDSSDGTFTSFASSFESFFKFLSYTFNYFPVGIKNYFVVGFTAIVVLAFLKKVV